MANQVKTPIQTILKKRCLKMDNIHTFSHQVTTLYQRWLRRRVFSVAGLYILVTNVIKWQYHYLHGVLSLSLSLSLSQSHIRMIDAFCFLVSFCFVYVSCLWCGPFICIGTNSHKTCLTQPHFVCLSQDDMSE